MNTKTREPSTVEHTLTDAQQHLVSVPELRQEFGLFDDDSQDELVAELEFAALGRCSPIIGAPVRTVNVTDRYTAWSDRLMLSLGFYAAVPALAVEYLDEAGASQTLAADWYLVDTTSRAPAVVFRGGVDALLELWPWHAAPVAVRWRSHIAGEGHHDAREAVLNAVRLLVSGRWETRGGGAAGTPDAFANLAVRLLSPHRRTRAAYR